MAGRYKLIALDMDGNGLPETGRKIFIKKD